jgi:hypothetical protein
MKGWRSYSRAKAKHRARILLGKKPKSSPSKRSFFSNTSKSLVLQQF